MRGEENRRECTGHLIEKFNETIGSRSYKKAREERYIHVTYGMPEKARRINEHISPEGT